MPDVDALTRAGDRRLRRRRWGTVGACAAAAVAVAVLASNLSATSVRRIRRPAPDATLPGDLGRPAARHVRPGPRHLVVGTRSSTTATSPSTWARPIDAFVRTQIGFVVRDSDGEVWEVDGDMQQRIGQRRREAPAAGQRRGDAGRRLGRPDRRHPGVRGARPRHRRHDAVRRGHRRRTWAPWPTRRTRRTSTRSTADTAYWRDERGAVATDLETGDVRVIDADARNGFDIVDVRGRPDRVLRGAGHRDRGQSAERRRHDARRGATAAWPTSPRTPATTPPTPTRPQVCDTRPASRCASTSRATAFSTAFDWIGNDTVVVLAVEDRAVARSSCSPAPCPVGRCTAYVDDLGTTEEIVGHFQLPVGETIGAD